MHHLLRALMIFGWTIQIFYLLNTQACANLANAQTLYVYEDKVTTTPVGKTRPLKIIRGKKTAPVLKVTRRIPYLELVHKHATAHGLPTSFILAVIRAESAFNPKAVSRVGAMGLMQLMPKVARAYGVKDAFDPEQNIKGGCALLVVLKKRHKGDVNRILGAYNVGGRNVRRRGGIPNIHTRAYAKKIIKYWAHYDIILKKMHLTTKQSTPENTTVRSTRP